jgi:hypothetical protein
LDGCLLGLFWTVAFFGGSLFGDIIIKDPKTKTKLQEQTKESPFSRFKEDLQISGLCKPKIKETGCLDESSDFVLYCCKQPSTCPVMLQYIELFLLSAAIVALFRKFWV